MRKRLVYLLAAILLVAVVGAALTWMRLRPTGEDDIAVALDCFELAAGGLLKLASERDKRFLGKVERTRGGMPRRRRGRARIATPRGSTGPIIGARATPILIGPRRLRLAPPDRNIARRRWRAPRPRIPADGADPLQSLRQPHFATYLTRPKTAAIRDVWPEMRLQADDPAYGLLKIAEDGSQTLPGRR